MAVTEAIRNLIQEDTTQLGKYLKLYYETTTLEEILNPNQDQYEFKGMAVSDNSILHSLLMKRFCNRGDIMNKEQEERISGWMEYRYQTEEEREKLSSYLDTNYGKRLKSELDSLVNEKQLKPIVMEHVLRQYANEYYRFHMKTNAWNSVRYYLENIPELFSFHEVLLRAVPVSKHFFIINKDVETEIEKIFAYQKVEFIKHEHVIPDGRTICIYIIYLENPRDFTIDTDPVRQSWLIAEDAGIRVGFHCYPTQEAILDGFVGLGLYRSFPIEKEDRYGDFSSASGGFREDLGAGFKSAWEANIARILNHKGIKWTYEKKSIQTEQGAYIPDFNVTANDQAYTIEVKGFWDDHSIKKTASARIQEKSEDEVIIIDSDLYELLCKAYENVIPHWEKSLVSSKSQQIPVVGINVGSRLKAIQSLNEGDALQLIREPENPFDKNAIKVYTKDGREIGFVAKDWASILAYKMDIGFSYAIALNKVEVEKKVVYIQVKTIPASVDLLNGILLFQ